MIGRSLAHYRITAKLGEGGMGEVWRATDGRLGRDVALKILPPRFTADPERLARFEREAKLLASLNHPGIAQIYGLEESDGVRALALELVEGPTLADRLLQGAIPWRDALPLFRELAAALAFAHERGIIHRDLKPSNIKLTSEGRIKVLDFGLAKALDPLGDPATAASTANSPTLMHSPTLTLAGTELGVILGTAAYMSPEQARARPVDKRADIWAYGVVLFESLTGRKLFEGETVSDILAAVLRQEIPWSTLPAETPAPLRRLLRRCLERDPKRRLHDLADAQADLEEAELPAEQTASGTAVEAVPRRRRIPAVIVALVAALAGAFLAYGWMLSRSAPPPAATPVRFELFPMSGASFDYPNGPATLSPDGQNLAFHVAPAGGTEEEVWVRPLGSLEAKPVAGSVHAYDPFWSPDGRSIGFFADNAGLMRVDVAAGSKPVTITSTIDGRGASWGSRNVIVFARDGRGPLFQVSANGGDATPATTLDAAAGELSHIRPFFLPDGDHFLFYAQSTQARRSGAVLAALSGGNSTFLLALDAPAAYASGQLLFVRGSTLFAQRLDLEKASLAGEPTPLVPDIAPDPRFLNRMFSASENGVLAFHAGSLELGTPIWFDRAGHRGEIVGGNGDQNLDISTDGTKLAVNNDDPSTRRPDVWTIDLARGIRARLSSSPAAEYGPVWSPDGRTIYFGRDHRTRPDALPEGAGAPPSAGTAVAAPPSTLTAAGTRATAPEPAEGVSILARNATGLGDETVLLRTRDPLEPIAASPDGRWLMFETFSPETRGDLEILALDGSGERRPFAATAAHEESGRFSPDGRFIAYCANESGQLEVYVQPWPPTGERWQISGGGGGSPRWRADGRELYYVARGRELMAVDIEIRPAFNLIAEQRLFAVPGSDYVVAPDGQRFLFRAERDESRRSPIHVLLNWTSLLAPEARGAR